MSDVVTIGGFTDNVEGVVPCHLDESGNPVALSQSNRLPVSDTEVDIALGRVNGRRFINKFGRNPSVESGPEDIWNGGGIYTGFPITGTAETLQVFSSDAADSSGGNGARTIQLIGLDADYRDLTETVTLNGTTPVTTVNAFWRMHTANVRSAGPGGFNVGTITARHSTTTANVFMVIPIGRNQSNMAAYTVPAGYTGVLRRLSVYIRSAVNARFADGEVWIRQFGLAARLRRPWSCNSNEAYRTDIYGGLVLPEKTDIVIRCSSVSTNPSDVIAEFDIEIVPDE